MTQIASKVATECRPLDWFKTDAGQLARHDDPEKIRLRGLDMLANGQLQPVGATEDGRLIFGHGRWLAAKAVGIKMLEVKLYPASLSDTQFKLIRAAENLQRNELTGYQKWLICTELMSGNPTWQMKDLAEQLHLDPSMVTRLLSPSKCTPAIQEALREGRIGISDCYEFSHENEEGQTALLRMKLAGASRNAIKDARRKSKHEEAAAVRLSRVKVEMPEATLLITGKELSMAGVVELLGETLKEARKAADQFDVKTWVRMMADKAKAR